MSAGGGSERGGRLFASNVWRLVDPSGSGGIHEGDHIDHDHSAIFGNFNPAGGRIILHMTNKILVLIRYGLGRSKVECLASHTLLLSEERTPLQGFSLIRTPPLLGPYSRTMPRALRWP